MYSIGELADQKAAQKIIKDLQANSIICEIKTDDNSGLHSIWVMKEEDIPFALERFRVALGFRKSIEVDPEWVKISKIPLGQISRVLIITSVFVYLCMNWITSMKGLVEFFFISTREKVLLNEVLRGEFWRLLTPIFIHFSFMHILFNMMWVKDLGSLIEQTKGPKIFLFLIILSGLLSNLAQYFVAGPHFGGMSGVVYAFLGYIWMQKKFCEGFDHGLPKRDVLFMLGFFVACMTGVFGGIANMAHALGLSVGMIFGLLPGLKGRGKEASLYILLAVAFSGLALAVEWWKRDGLLYFFSLT